MSYMRKLFLLCVFNWAGLPCLTLKGWQLSEFESIVLDLKISQLPRFEQAIAQQYNVAPQLNSEFSVSDNVYIVKGDRNTLKALKSKLTTQNSLNQITSTLPLKFQRPRL